MRVWGEQCLAGPCPAGNSPLAREQTLAAQHLSSFEKEMSAHCINMSIHL
jgi:hypothetical protein